jgi:hypothetical protein
MEGLVVEHAHRVAAGQDAAELVPGIRRARARMARDWEMEKATPVFPGETDLWVEIDAATAAVDAAVERVLHATFDPYIRAASSSIPGLGLGLATVRRLVEARGGSVGVEAGPEGGSLFGVELPRAAGDGGRGAARGES